MTNHIHLIIQTGEAPLSRIMQNLSLRYTKWINFTQKRTGHLFQGRYKALLLDADAYLAELVRYIHLNPVRAGMVTSPDDYPWSSHHAYLGKENLSWLTTDWTLSLLSSDIQKAWDNYALFIADGLGEQRRAEFHSGTLEGRLLGDDIFIDEAFRKADQKRDRACRTSDIVNTVCRRYGITTEQIKAPGKSMPYAEARAVAALLVMETSGASLTELGKILRRDIAAIGRAGRRLLDESCKAECLKTKLDELRQELIKISERIGAGIGLRRDQLSSQFGEALESMLSDDGYRQKAAGISQKYAGYDQSKVVVRLANTLENLNQNALKSKRPGR